jgi:HSP20 family protein
MLQLLDELTYGSPWRNFDRLHRELSRAFNPFVVKNRAPVNVYANEDAVKVLVNIPGWKAEWFELSVEGTKLLLKGEEKDVDHEPMRLNRVINLPFGIQEDSVAATYKDGMLTVDLKRSEQDKPKKIAIQSA